jgi:large subunit ribosomal protein L6
MSRIGKQPVPIPSGVKVSEAGRVVQVQGPKGQLKLTLRPEVEVAISAKEVTVTRSRETRQARAYHGMTRAMIANMFTGVTKGYEKALDIIGVGWNAAVQGRKVVLNVGFSHPVTFEIPEGLTVACPNPTAIVITGSDKQMVGQLAAALRASRKPEPYKGKGVRYKGEFVRQKAGKSFGS